VLEGIFNGLSGWIGGDRSNKKSAKKGIVVQSYRRDPMQLERDILDGWLFTMTALKAQEAA